VARDGEEALRLVREEAAGTSRCSNLDDAPKASGPLEVLRALTGSSGASEETAVDSRS